MQRVIAYVDGFNLYYGLRSKGWRRYYWLDIRRLAENLLQSHQHLDAVHYFTSRVYPDPGSPGNRKRQDIFLEALETLPGMNIHYGHYLSKERVCSSCGATWQTYEEKMTDVNIAVELLGDAQDDVFDTAIVISGDSDLTGPINAVRRRRPDKRIIVAFPPNRVSNQLKKVATGWFTISRKKLKDSQLPTQATKANGYVLTRPSNWS